MNCKKCDCPVFRAYTIEGKRIVCDVAEFDVVMVRSDNRFEEKKAYIPHKLFCKKEK